MHWYPVFLPDQNPPMTWETLPVSSSVAVGCVTLTALKSVVATSQLTEGSELEVLLCQEDHRGPYLVGLQREMEDVLTVVTHYQLCEVSSWMATELATSVEFSCCL